MAGTLVKTVTLQITGEIKDAAEKIGLIRKDVQDLADKSPVELKAELAGSEEVKARLKEIEANAERLKKEFPEFAAKIDIGAASAKLAVLRAEIRKTADTGRSLSDRISGIGTALAKVTPAWTGFLAAGLALGPALLPVLAAVTAGVLGMGAALAHGAGSAVGVFAIAASSNLTQMKKDLLKLQAAEIAANTALATSAKNRTKSQDAAIAKARQLSAAFTKTYGPEAKAIEKLKSAWKLFITQPIVTSTLAKGMQLITAVLPHLVPLLKLGANFAQAFIGALSGFTLGGGLDKLVKTLVKLGTIGLTGILRVLHNLAVAFGALSGGAGNFAQGAINGLVKLSAVFASWAQNKGPGALAGLMATIRKLGPDVVRLVTSLAAAVPNLAKGLFPLAPLSLALSAALAGIIAHANPHVITVLATAFLALWGAVKLIVAVTKAWEGVQLVMNVILAANPVGLIIIAVAGLTAGIILAYKHSETFRRIVQGAFHVVLAVVQGVWHWIKGNWPLLLGILIGPIGLAVLAMAKYWRQIWTGVKFVWNWIRGNWQLLLGILTGPVGAAVTFITGHWHTIVSGAQNVLNFFRGIWQNLTHLLEAPFQAALKVIRGIWNTLRTIIDKITGFFTSGAGGGPLPGGHGGGVPGRGGGPAQAQAYAQSIMGKYGMSAGTQFPALQQLWNNESGWRWNAQNPTSPAYGIPQADPGSKMAAAGADWRTNYATQVRWGLGYIRGAYGQPTTALAAWEGRSPHWYDSGTQYLPPGLSLAMNATGRPERVGGEDLAPLLRENNMLLRKLPGVMAAHLGRALSGRPVAPRPSVFASR